MVNVQDVQTIVNTTISLEHVSVMWENMTLTIIFVLVLCIVQLIKLSTMDSVSVDQDITK
jgi:uncharacterized membrane-anchored protein YitT (DUF2179 family)